VLVCTTAPAHPATADGDEPQDVVTAVDRFMAARMQTSAIPGAAVAVIRGDRVLSVRGYGHDSTGAQVTGDSLFRIASLSKSFTALAVMQLVDAGLLDLEDPVQVHLPEFQLADPRADRLTVRQLLDHTSGLTDAVVPELSRPQPTTPAEATTSLRSARLATSPGTTYSYHNPNYEVAARLIEVVSGEPFDTYMRRHVYGPAGMTSTSSTVTDDEPVPGLADGHVVAYGRAVPTAGPSSFSVGGGDVVSSAADMARWLIVHANGGRTADGTQLVSRSGMETLHRPSAPMTGYALGWGTHGPIAAPTRIEHSGSLLSFSAEQAIWPRSGYGVALLFNSGSAFLLDQLPIVHGVFDILEGRQPPSGAPSLALRLDAVLALLTVTALTLGARGAVRAGRWARRWSRSPRRAALGLLPSLLTLGAGTAFPDLAELWIGRDVTWGAAAYGWPALVVFALASLLAAAVTLAARSWQLCRTGGAEAPSRTRYQWWHAAPPTRTGDGLLKESPSTR
jgi:CubicO group peptidase (beta-lactamase class C family)